MAAINLVASGRVISFDRLVHIIGGIALEHPPAAHREQRVAGKGMAVDHKGDGAARVARHFQHPHRAAGEFPARSFVHAHVDARECGAASLPGPTIIAPYKRLQFQIAADMVDMVVGVEDISGLPAQPGPAPP